MGFSRQEYWSGLPFPPLEGLPNPGIEPLSLMPPELVGKCFSTSATCGKGRPLHFTFTKHFHIYYLMWASHYCFNFSFFLLRVFHRVAELSNGRAYLQAQASGLPDYSPPHPWATPPVSTPEVSLVLTRVGKQQFSTWMKTQLTRASHSLLVEA